MQKVDKLDDRIKKVDLDVVELSDTLVGRSCESGPCMFNGTCIDLKNNMFICLCSEGFGGVTCNISMFMHTAS